MSITHEEKCDICFESVDKKIMCILPCKHMLCIQCIFKVEEPKCHICRKFYGNFISELIKPPNTRVFEEFDRF